MSAATALRTALPYIVVGGALGALIGSALGSIANGFRVGVTFGGVVAFVVIQRKKTRDSSDKCFACAPGIQSEQQRFLCLDHKSQCRLENGELLSDVLDRTLVQDEGGSLLARIFNPVFVTNVDGKKVKGWTDFHAGGMAVLEDRSSSSDYFEFFATGPGYGSVVRVLAQWDKHLDQSSLPVFFFELDKQLKRGDSLDWRVMDVLWETWRGVHRIAAKRAETGRLWPESTDELLTWLSLDANDEEMSDEFLSALQALSTREPPGA